MKAMDVAPDARLEAHREPHLDAVVDQLEEIVVLVALLVLEEVGEVIAGVELGMWTEEVREPNARVRETLLEVHRPPLLAAAVHPRAPVQQPFGCFRQ